MSTGPLSVFRGVQLLWGRPVLPDNNRNRFSEATEGMMFTLNYILGERFRNRPYWQRRGEAPTSPMRSKTLRGTSVPSVKKVQTASSTSMRDESCMQARPLSYEMAQEVLRTLDVTLGKVGFLGYRLRWFNDDFPASFSRLPRAEPTPCERL